MSFEVYDVIVGCIGVHDELVCGLEFFVCENICVEFLIVFMWCMLFMLFVLLCWFCECGWVIKL